MFGKKKQGHAETPAPTTSGRVTVTVTGTDGILTNFHDVTPEQAERLQKWDRDRQAREEFLSRWDD